MSQLKVNTIRHTGASSDAITLAADGTAAIGECTAKITNPPPGNRNLIINGAMIVAQRGTSSTADGYHTVDRFQTGATGNDDVFTQEQISLTSSDTGPWEKGFRKAFQLKNGDQTSGTQAGDNAYIGYVIEAQDLVNSGWNYTSASSYITLSFWIKSSVAGNNWVHLYNFDGTAQGYSFLSGNLSANTWTKVTHSIPGNANLTLDNNNSHGFWIQWSAYLGTNYTTSGHTVNQWAAYNSASRQPDMAAATWWTSDEATYALTGVQLEVGDVATDFEHRSYGDELRRCQRYYFQFGGSTAETDRFLIEGYTKSTSFSVVSHISYNMRAAPAVSKVGTWSESAVGSMSFNYRDTNQCAVRLIANANDACSYAHTDADSYLTFSAEL